MTDWLTWMILVPSLHRSDKLLSDYVPLIANEKLTEIFFGIIIGSKFANTTSFQFASVEATNTSSFCHDMALMISARVCFAHCVFAGHSWSVNMRNSQEHGCNTMVQWQIPSDETSKFSRATVAAVFATLKKFPYTSWSTWWFRPTQNVKKLSLTCRFMRRFQITSLHEHWKCPHTPFESKTDFAFICIHKHCTNSRACTNPNNNFTLIDPHNVKQLKAISVIFRSWKLSLLW